MSDLILKTTSDARRIIREAATFDGASYAWQVIALKMLDDLDTLLAANDQLARQVLVSEGQMMRLKAALERFKYWQIPESAFPDPREAGMAFAREALAMLAKESATKEPEEPKR